MARHSDYSKTKTELICALIMEGKTLVHICALENMPAYSTVCQWLAKHKEFAENYARARQSQADFFADEMVVIADTEPDPQVARVRMDARKWHAAHTSPKKYGEKIFQEHSGVVNVTNLTDEELLRLAESTD